MYSPCLSIYTYNYLYDILYITMYSILSIFYILYITIYITLSLCVCVHTCVFITSSFFSTASEVIRSVEITSSYF